jgi:glycosyltransferase involved in cell wall biosynthesis
VSGTLLPVDGLVDGLELVLNDWLSNPLLLKQMGVKSRKRAEQLFSWEGVANELSQIYQSL